MSKMNCHWVIHIISMWTRPNLGSYSPTYRLLASAFLSSPNSSKSPLFLFILLFSCNKSEADCTSNFSSHSSQLLSITTLCSGSLWPQLSVPSNPRSASVSTMNYFKPSPSPWVSTCITITSRWQFYLNLMEKKNLEVLKVVRRMSSSCPKVTQPPGSDFPCLRSMLVNSPLTL